MTKLTFSFLLLLFITGASFAQDITHNAVPKPNVLSGIQFRAGIAYTGYVGYMGTGALAGMGITSSSIDIEARMTEGITDVYATSGYDDDDTFSKTLQFQILFSRWL